MNFRIPAKYNLYSTNTYIFSATLYKQLCFAWSLTEIRRVVKTPEFREEYDKNNKLFGERVADDIGKILGVTYVVDNGTNLDICGDGPKIFIKIRSIATIYFDPCDLFYIPDGIKHKSKLYKRLDDILQWLNCYTYKSPEKRLTLETISINPCPILDKRFMFIENTYNLSINVWQKHQKEFLKLRIGAIHKGTELSLHFQKETNSFFLITNKDKYFQDYFTCKNFEKGCHYSFCRKTVLHQHEKNCHSPEERVPKIKQKVLGPSKYLMNKAINFGLISKYPKNENFIFFDVECVLPKIVICTKKTTVVCSHKLVSIAANSFINNEHTQRFWVVKDSSVDSEIDIVRQFLEFCYSERDRTTKCVEVEQAVDKIYQMTKHLNNDFFDSDELFELKLLLEPFTDLPVFGYNNCKYDNNVIFSHIVKVLDKTNFLTKEVNLLKKGNQYFSIKFHNLHFKDLMNFTCPISLDKYLKTWTSNFKKLVYPYEFFECIEDIRSCIHFPSKATFYSTLKGAVDEDLFNECKSKYEHHHALPTTDIDHWPNFESYLRYYNLSDVHPASCGLITQFKTYQENFGLSPMQSLGLPSFAKAAMFKLYDPTCPSIFTFPAKSDATAMFRKNVIGGLCNVYARHVTTTDETANYAARYNNNGTNMKDGYNFNHAFFRRTLEKYIVFRP